MNIFIINGAPRVGKDTLINKLSEYLPDAYVLPVKQVLYERLASEYDLTLERTLYLCTELKDTPCDEFNGSTPRQALITLSEKKLKPRYGEIFVANLFIERLLEIETFGRKNFIVCCGFKNEVDFIRRVLRRFGLEKLYVVRVVNGETDFETLKDSRELIPLPDMVINNDIIEEPHMLGENMLKQFKEWYPV